MITNFDISQNKISRSTRFFQIIIQERAITLSITILLLVLIMSISYPDTFFTINNLRTILVNSSYEGIIAIGMTILLISGGFDLSAGSVMLFSGVVTAYFIKALDVNIAIAILVGLIAAAIVGLFNGFIIARIGVNPFIGTLITMGGIAGITVLIAGTGIVNLGDNFIAISQTKFLTIPMPFWYLLLIIFIFNYLLTRNRFFRQYYYIGGNEHSARLSGIDVIKLKIIGYIMSASFAGFAGILFAARMNLALSYSNTGIVLRVITAVVLGGASLEGGQGSIFGSILGVIFLNLVSNSLVIGHVSDSMVDVIRGLILVFAVAADIMIKKRFSRNNS